MFKLALAEQMRELDRLAIEERGYPGCQLMEIAGYATACGIMQLQCVEHEAAVFCGSGNNGGDGFVIARYLARADWKVEVFLLSDPEKLRGDARLNYERLENCPVKKFMLDADGLEDFAAFWKGRGVVVDALFGTGLARDLDGIYRQAVETINKVSGFKVAVDIPSGLSADSGHVLGVAVKADATWTYGLRKLGMHTYRGPELCGDIKLVDIGIPSDLIENQGLNHFLISENDARSGVKARDRLSHKGNFGHLLLIAGSADKPGAALMAAEAALRAGVGLLTLASHPVAAIAAVGRAPEAMTAQYSTPAELRDMLPELIKGKTALAVGPGWGCEAEKYEILLQLCRDFEGALLLDADALTLISGRERRPWIERAEAGKTTIITPHPGEAARLLEVKHAGIVEDRAWAVRELAFRFGAVAVLKGAATLVCRDGMVFVNPSGNPGMACGGSGDVLTGIAGAFAACGGDALDYMIRAVYLHGLAGDMAAAAKGQGGMKATDLIQFVPDILREWEEGRAVYD